MRTQYDNLMEAAEIINRAKLTVARDEGSPVVYSQLQRAAEYLLLQADSELAKHFSALAAEVAS